MDHSHLSIYIPFKTHEWMAMTNHNVIRIKNHKGDLGVCECIRNHNLTSPPSPQSPVQITIPIK